jgi:4-amino-4-deoxy-L-arabinose transferase-like glycosyltransferase
MSKSAVVFLLLIAIYFCSIGIDTMDVDASQYASMSREMSESGSYLQVYEQGKDYLDKPPLLFWLSSLSITIFGATNFAYKFPSILFAILALFSTYRFARLFYEQTIAFWSALVLGSSQAFFLITNDIRTDTILMSCVITSIWLLSEWYQSQRMVYFVAGFFAMGLGLLAKGPVAVIVPVLSFGIHFLLKRQFNFIFRWEYIIGLFVLAVLLLPMSLGLYQQFDAHPEKTVNGLKNVSGLRFYYWTQSFGRITGESVWNNHASFSFLFENLLWGMLPWTLFFVTGLICQLTFLIKARFRVGEPQEMITLGGFLLSYCALGISKYQLPHYIYVVLPFIAIITARMIASIYFKREKPVFKKWILPVQILVIGSMLTLPFLILVYVFPSSQFFPWILAAAACILVSVILLNAKIQHKLLVISLACIMALNVFMSLWFYPQLLHYQAGNNAGKFISRMNIDRDHFYMYQFQGNRTSLHFYSRTYLLTMDEGLDTIRSSGRLHQIVYQGLDFRVSTLNAGFINKDTRSGVCKKYYIVRLM